MRNGCSVFWCSYRGHAVEEGICDHAARAIRYARRLGRRGILASRLPKTATKTPENSSQIAVSLFKVVNLLI